MKDDNINIDIQLGIDAITQILEEIKEELAKQNENSQDNPRSVLNTDLLNKISETIEQAKKAIDEEDLKKFLNIVISVTTELQERANKASAEFLNQKIAELKELVKQPTIIEKRYSIDFKSSKTVIAIIFLSLGLFCSLFGNYNQYQENSRLTDNDLKYRFVKMKNGILSNEITRLENFFFYSDSAYVVNNIRKSVIDYEYRLQEHARKQEQKRQSEKKTQKLDKEINQLNVK